MTSRHLKFKCSLACIWTRLLWFVSGDRERISLCHQRTTKRLQGLITDHASSLSLCTYWLRLQRPRWKIHYSLKTDKTWLSVCSLSEILFFLVTDWLTDRPPACPPAWANLTVYSHSFRQFTGFAKRIRLYHSNSTNIHKRSQISTASIFNSTAARNSKFAYPQFSTPISTNVKVHIPGKRKYEAVPCAKHKRV